jgi:hypothetical protein
LRGLQSRDDPTHSMLYRVYVSVEKTVKRSPESRAPEFQISLHPFILSAAWDEKSVSSS